MAFTAKAAGVPEGQYVLEFTDWEQSVHAEYGGRVKWTFAVTDGPQKDAVTSRFTSDVLSPKTEFGKLIFKACVGRLPVPGDQFDPQAHLGKRFLGVVAETDSGATRVVSLMPLAQPAAQPAAAGGDGCPF